MRSLKRVAWDDYAVFVEGLEAFAGGAENLRALTRASYYRGVPELQKLVGLVVSPKTLFRFLFDVLDPIVYPMIEWSCTDLGPREMRVTASLRPGIRPCAALFRSTDGPIEAIPTTLGLPPAIVIADHTSIMGSWHVTLPKLKRLPAAARALSLGAVSRTLRTLVIVSEHEGSSLATSFLHHGAAREERLELATQRWRLTRRQGEVHRALLDRALSTT